MVIVEQFQRFAAILNLLLGSFYFISKNEVFLQLGSFRTSVQDT